MLRLEAVSVHYGDVVAVDDATLDVSADETVALLGRSGSGKTTLLRAIAGLVPLAAGRITLDGEDLAPTPTHQRHAGFVFQDFALFPHLDVEGNVGYGPTTAGIDGIGDVVAGALERVGLTGMQRRRIDQLSGGEAQRVALARTLATRPRILLLDEPLGSLDPALRSQVAAELDSLLAATEIPTIIVTHDTREAFSLGDRIVVLDDGRIAATGSPAQMWTDPGTAEVARILGHTGVVTAEVSMGRCDVGGVPVPVPPGIGDGRRTLLLRDGAARAADEGHAVRVRSSRYQGPGWVTAVDFGDTSLDVATADQARSGETITIVIDPGAVIELE